MTYSPKVKEMNILQQGGQSFIAPAGWIDSVAATGTKVDYDLTAARSAMGLVAGQPLFVIFAADGPFWANFHAAAVIPTATTTDGSSSEFSPAQRYLASDITTISLISAAAQKISLQFYRP